MHGFYVTTSIPYVNAAPHLGHALEFVQADVLARHRRLRGQPVRFLTGTDDNALKNVTAARAAGVDVGAFVSANTARFVGLRETLDLSFDDVLHTGRDPRHAAGVEQLWRRSAARGDFERRAYTGRYCAGCEQFYADAELDGGRCREHGTRAEEVVEENWFFRLSRYAARIEDAITSGRVRIEPETRRNEVLAFLRGGVVDISVSRPAARAPGWGIPVPDDPTQVIYVWWDALANYVTALGLTGPDHERWWAGSAQRVHVIGKGIVRFHAVHWLALLLSADLPLPSAVFVHPYLGVDGVKLSKSTGTAVDPVDLVDRFGTDALRWWLVRDVAREADTDFTVARLVERHDRDLAHGVGNLANRTVSLVHRLRDGRVPVSDADLLPAGAVAPAVDAALNRFDLRAATGAVWELVEQGNRFVERERPWALTDDSRLDNVLAALVRACRVIAAELSLFVPGAASRLAAQLGDGDRVGAAGPVFPRLDAPRPATLRG